MNLCHVFPHCVCVRSPVLVSYNLKGPVLGAGATGDQEEGVGGLYTFCDLCGQFTSSMSGGEAGIKQDGAGWRVGGVGG